LQLVVLATVIANHNRMITLTQNIEKHFLKNYFLGTKTFYIETNGILSKIYYIFVKYLCNVNQSISWTKKIIQSRTQAKSLFWPPTKNKIK
jgi:hypothetical protein